jgi:signal transduction histidine kinase
MDRARVRLLLIDGVEDDDSLVRQRLSHIAPFSFDLEVAGTIELGILMLARHEHDICLLDFDLIADQGLDLAALLRGPGAEIPMVLLRGDAPLDIEPTGTLDFIDKADMKTPLFERVIRYAIDRCRAMSALKQTEMRLRALIERTPEASVIQDRTAQARLMLSDRLSSVGTLAAGISHEINNPLAYVLSNVSFAKDELSRLADEVATAPSANIESMRGKLSQVMDALVDANQGAERVQSIVRDLRSFSRAEEDRRGPVDVHRVLEVAITVARSEVRRRAQLVTEYQPDLPEIDANEGRLAQVFINVLLNAAHAIPEGNPRDEWVRIITREGDQRRVVVEITDTGVGMAADVRARAFDPFFTTKPIGVGTGLGLFVCHSIVSSIGGIIAVDSAPGRGSTFRIEFPSRASQAMQAAPMVRSTPPRRGTLLIVDDEPLVCSSLKRSLTRDYEVKTVHSARAALDLIEGGEQFDLILCDLMMPEMSGMDLYYELGRRHSVARDRMVFFTGGAFTARAREFLNAVPNARLEKPADIGQIRALLRQRLAS